MHYMALPVSFRWPDDFVARIDAARGLVSRSAFVRQAVEEKLEPPLPLYVTMPPGRKKATAVNAGTGPEPEVSSPRYKCRAPGCDFTALSPAAKCPRHPGTLDLA